MKTGLITTEASRDSIEIARGNRPDFFNLHYVKPPPFVPRYLRRECRDDSRRSGDERRPSTSRPARNPRRLPRRRGRGGRDLPAPLLREPGAREGRARARARAGQVSAVASHQISREWRGTSGRAPSSCRRTFSLWPSATWAGSPRSSRAAASADSSTSCSRTAASTRSRRRRRSRSRWSSRPASGWGAAELGRLLGDANVLALDIGGTTAKCSLIEGGHVKIISDYWIERDRAGRLPDPGAGGRRRQIGQGPAHRLGRRVRPDAVDSRRSDARSSPTAAAADGDDDVPPGASAANPTTSAATTNWADGRPDAGAIAERFDVDWTRPRAASFGSRTTT